MHLVWYCTVISDLYFFILLNCTLVVLSDTKLLCLESIFSNVIKSKEFQYPEYSKMITLTRLHIIVVGKLCNLVDF